MITPQRLNELKEICEGAQECEPDTTTFTPIENIRELIMEVECLGLDNRHLQELKIEYFKTIQELRQQLADRDAAIKVLVESMKDVRSEMTHPDSLIDFEWCINQICNAINLPEVKKVLK